MLPIVFQIPFIMAMERIITNHEKSIKEKSIIDFSNVDNLKIKIPSCNKLNIKLFNNPNPFKKIN
jgi:hypothetical protein